MNNESKSKLRYIFEDNKITYLVEKTNLSFEQHEKYFLDFYYDLWKLKKQCETLTIDNDNAIFEYLAENDKGEVVERKKKFSFNTMIKHLFNVDKTQLSRGFNVLKRFSDFSESDIQKQTVTIKPEYENFSYSKLMELLPYKEEYVVKMIDDGKILAEQSVRDLRKVLQDKPETIPYIPEPFELDRNKEYQMQDFRNYGRNDLISISYQCYQSYLRLKKQLLLNKVNK